MCTVSTDSTYKNKTVNQPTVRSIVEHTIKSEVMETAKLNLDCGNLCLYYRIFNKSVFILVSFKIFDCFYLSIELSHLVENKSCNPSPLV